MFKTKIFRILGVAVTLAMMASFLVAAAPASAATQAWGTFATPTGGASGKWVLADSTTLSLDGNTGLGFEGVGLMKKAIDGTIYANAMFVNPDPTTATTTSADGVNVMPPGTPAGRQGNYQGLFKSTDGGRTWSKLTIPLLDSAAPGGKDFIFSIVCSSQFANTVYFTDGKDIYKTSDGGATWVVISDAFTTLVYTPGLGGGGRGIIDAMDVGYIGTSPYIFIGTTSFNGNENCFAAVCQEAVYSSPWNDLFIMTNRTMVYTGGCDVWDIKVDPGTTPGFGTSQMVSALFTQYGGLVNANSTIFTSKYGGAQWGSNVMDTKVSAGSTNLFDGHLWFPSNFSSTVSSGLFQCFAALAANNAGSNALEGGVFLIPGGAATGIDLSPEGTSGDTNLTTIDGTGPVGAAQLIVGGYDPDVGTPGGSVPVVYTSMNNGLTWTISGKEPTGGSDPYQPTAPASATVIALSGTTALVGTFGADSGVSITADWGATFNTISLINGKIAVINDLATTINGSTVFMATNGNTLNITGSSFNPPHTSNVMVYSIWRNTGSPAATSWERVLDSAQIVNGVPVAENLNTLSLTPAGDGIFAGVTNTAGIFIWRSLSTPGSLGQVWAQMATALPVGVSLTQYDWMAATINRIVVGGVTATSNNIYTTDSNGVIWTAYTCPVGTVTSIASLTSDATGNTLLAGGTGGGTSFTSGSVATSTDGGHTWTAISSAVPGTWGVGTTLIATFNNSYTTPQEILVTGSLGGVWRYSTADASPAWAEIDNVMGYPPNASSTTVYSADTFVITVPVATTPGGTITIQQGGIFANGQGVVVTSSDPTNLPVAFTGFTGTWIATVGTLVANTTLTVTAVGTVPPVQGIVTNATSSTTLGVSTFVGPNTLSVFPTAAQLNAGTFASGFSLQNLSGSTATTTNTNPFVIVNGTGIISTTGATGMVYTIGSPASTTGSVTRIKGRETSTSQVYAEAMLEQSGTTSFQGSNIWYTMPSSGGITVWTLGGTTAATPTKIYTYTDTLAVFGTGAAASQVTTTSATISWNVGATSPFANASGTVPLATSGSSYKVVVTSVSQNSIANFARSRTDTGITVTVDNTGLGTAKVTGLTPGTTYFFNIFAASPVSSFNTGGTTTFSTLPMAPVYTSHLSPPDGAMDVSVKTSFAWDAVPGATSYDFQLSTDPNFADASKDVVKTSITGGASYYTPANALSNATVYYWRVRAVTPTGTSAYVTSVFTTVAATAAPVTVTNAAPVTLTVPPQETPAYIWLIVAVGAILTIAVIVLIVRTRRVV